VGAIVAVVQGIIASLHGPEDGCPWAVWDDLPKGPLSTPYAVTGSSWDMPRLKADGRDQRRSAVTATKTAAMTVDNALHAWTAVEYRPSAQTAMEGPRRCAHYYGSEGWGVREMASKCHLPRGGEEALVTQPD